MASKYKKMRYDVRQGFMTLSQAGHELKINKENL